MKSKYYFIVLMCLISNNVYSDNIFNVKKSVFEFLVQYEGCREDNKEDYDYPIVEIKQQKSIDECTTGIFLFNAINFHGAYAHFVLVGKDCFQIINMRESFNGNLEKLIVFFENNSQYNKEDILFYISAFIRINENNLNPSGVIFTKRQPSY